MKIPLLLAASLLSAPALAEDPPTLDDAVRQLHQTATEEGRRIGRRPRTSRSEMAAAAALAAGGTKAPEPPAPPAGDRVGAVAAAGGWQDDAAANAGLDDATKAAGYRIQSRLAEGGSREYNVIAPAGFFATGARSYAGVKNLRGVGRYVYYEIGDAGAAYQDLTLKALQSDAYGLIHDDFATVAQFDRANGRVASVTAQQAGGAPRFLSDDVLLVDALKRLLGYDDAQVALVKRNLAQARGSNRYVVYGANRHSVVIALEANLQRTIRIHPATP